MCMWDVGDGPQVYRHRVVKARKPHTCVECGRQIEIGERYHYDFQVYDGDPFCAHTCEHCRVAEKWLIRECGGYLIHAVWEDIRDHIVEYPRLRFPLGRLMVRMNKKWRDANGSLFPLPAVPDIRTGEYVA